MTVTSLRTGAAGRAVLLMERTVTVTDKLTADRNESEGRKSWCCWRAILLGKSCDSEASVCPGAKEERTGYSSSEKNCK